MRILINASNLKKGGGLQVADSICGLLSLYPQHSFIVVLSSYLSATLQKINSIPNVNAVQYNMPKRLEVILFQRDSFLDTLVEKEKVDVVITIFGPSLWKPKCQHISGFARAQCVLTDSPYFKQLSFRKRLVEKIGNMILIWAFNRCSDIYYTENELISDKLQILFPLKKIYTITNYYNQIFDEKEMWEHKIKLDNFQGITLLTISANYPHKNLSIIKPTILYLKKHYPHFSFRFVLTIDESEYLPLTSEERKHILFLGKVPIEECPNLYAQSDVVFLPTLLECYSASYPEAMRMEKPIITTDLNFAHSLCGDAALYYSALSPAALGDSIYNMAVNEELRAYLVENGKKQLLKFDNYEMRIRKIIKLVERETV